MRVPPLLSVFCMVVVSANVRLCLSEELKWGDLKGQILFDGELPKTKPIAQVPRPGRRPLDVWDESLEVHSRTKGIANVFVYLSKRPESVHPDLERPNVVKELTDEEEVAAPDVTIEDFRFEPHVMLVPVGFQIEIGSVDPVPHNVNFQPLKNTPHNMALEPRDRRTWIPFRVSEKLPVKVTNDDYPWMSAYWLGLDHPYAAVSDRKGRFAIPQLPVGRHELWIWQERFGRRKQTVEIHEGPNQLEPFKFEAPP